MAIEVFTAEWAQQWCRNLNASQAYRAAASAWQGAVIVVLEAEPARGRPEPRAVFADLRGGECLECRVAGPEDHARAPYVFSADLHTWRNILKGEADPAQALMSGRLRLVKGNLLGLAPHVQAAQELIAAARGIETVFPDHPEPR
jgi:putative sterol carrier protein